MSYIDAYSSIKRLKGDVHLARGGDLGGGCDRPLPPMRFKGNYMLSVFMKSNNYINFFRKELLGSLKRQLGQQDRFGQRFACHVTSVRDVKSLCNKSPSLKKIEKKKIIIKKFALGAGAD